MAPMRRCGLLAVAILAVAAQAAARDLLQTRPAAASSLDPNCPYSALYIVATLPKIKTVTAWNAVKPIYIAAWQRLLPAGSSVIPAYTEPEDGALAVHTILVFNGTVASGKAAALNLHVRLLGDPRPFFSGAAVSGVSPAHHGGGSTKPPTDLSPFGDVHFESISHPYLSDSVGRTIQGTIPNTNAAAQFSMAWLGISPAQLGQLEVKRYVKAIQAKMPPGTYVQFTPMIDDGVSTYRFASWQQSTAAAAVPTVAHHLGGSGAGSLWGGSKPTTGPTANGPKAVWNTAVTATTTQALENLLALLRQNPALVFPTAYFKQMELEQGSAVRLVPTPAFVSACQAKPVIVKRPVLTFATAFGPTTGQALAAGAAGVTYTSWIFTATAPDGSKVSVTSLIPDARWGTTAATALRPSTTYTVSVVGVQADGQAVPASNTLPMITPAAATPSIPAADPTSQTSATIVLNAPPGVTAQYFMLKLCPQPSGTCLNRNCPDIFCNVQGLSAGAKYTVSAQAVVNNKPIPASNTMPLQMPAPGAPTLTEAQDRSSTRGFALAAPPAGGSCDAYVFTFAPVNGAGSSKPVVVEVTTLSVNANTLTPATTYDVSVQCKRGGVLSGPSNTKQIVTAAPDAPSNQGVPTGPKQANIQITPPQALPPSGSPWVQFKLTVCPVRGPSTACVRRTCTTLLCTVPGLSPATTYVVQTVAVAEDGSQSVPSNEAPFTTPSLPPTPPNPHAEAKSPTEAEIDVTAPTVGGPCNKYSVRVCPTNNNPGGCVTRDCGPPVKATGVTVCPTWTGLTGGTSYTVQATCVKADGSTGPISDPETFATPTAGAPAVAADPVNAVTGVAHCTKPATGGPYVNYELTVCVKGTTNCLQNLPLCPISGSGTVTDCPINGCEPLTTYEVTIYALKADNTKSPISNKDDFQTPAAPAPGISVNDADTTDTSTTAKVTPPSIGGPWTNYKLTVCTAGTCKDVNCAPADIASCDITGLKPSTAYTVVVVAQKTGFPDSLVGGPDTFTTDAPAPLVGSLTTCKTDADCQKTTGELCDATQKKCYCPSPRAWCPGTVGEPFCCGAGQTCGDVLIKGKTEQGCRCSKTEYDDCLGTAGVSNGCKATSSASNPYTCAQCDADRATCTDGYACGAQKCDPVPK